MKSDLEIIQEALKRVSSYRWVNLGTVTEGMQVLSREIEILSKERDAEEEKLRDDCDAVLGEDAIYGG